MPSHKRYHDHHEKEPDTLLELKLEPKAFIAIKKHLNGKIPETTISTRITTLNTQIHPLFPHHKALKLCVILVPSLIAAVYIAIQLWPQSTPQNCISMPAPSGQTSLSCSDVTDTRLPLVRNAAIAGASASLVLHFVIWWWNLWRDRVGEAALQQVLDGWNLEEELGGVTWGFVKRSDRGWSVNYFVTLHVADTEESMYWAGKSAASIASHHTEGGATVLEITEGEKQAFREMVAERGASTSAFEV